MSDFDLSQICKIAGIILTFAVLVKASSEDVKTRTVANKHPICIVVIFTLSAFGQWLIIHEAMPLTTIATQFVFAIGIGLLLLVITVGVEKVEHKELFGGADIKIVAATTLFLGVDALVAAMLVSCFLFVLGAFFQRRNFDSWASVTLPFVPFWTVGFIVALVAAYLW